MGNQADRREREDEWTVVSTVGQVTHVRHAIYQYEAESRIVSLQTKELLQAELEQYAKRKQMKGPLVQCYTTSQTEKKTFGICGDGFSIAVLTQKMTTWEDIQFNRRNGLSLEEHMYALNEIIVGYEILHDLMGAFEITENMFGVNQYREIRVWLNQNFAVNHVATTKQKGKKRSSKGVMGKKINIEIGSTKRGMIRNILDLMENACGRYQEEYLQLKGVLIECQDFKSALKRLNQFVQERRLSLPDRIGLEDHYNNSPANKETKNKGLSPIFGNTLLGKDEQSTPGIEVMSKKKIYKQDNGGGNKVEAFSVHEQKSQSGKKMKNEGHGHIILHKKRESINNKKSGKQDEDFQITNHKNGSIKKQKMLFKEQQNTNLYQQLLKNPNIKTTQSLFRTITAIQKGQSSEQIESNRISSPNKSQQSNKANISIHQRILKQQNSASKSTKPKINMTFKYG